MNGIKKGIWPTMITPYDREGRVDLNAAKRIVDWYARRNCDGIFAVCQSSEMFNLSLEERVALARTVVEAAQGRLEVIASGHISDDPQAQVEELGAIAETGVKAVVMVSNRLAREDEDDEVWIRNAQRILDALPGVTFGVYECPYPYKRLMTERTLGWCARSGRFAFLKDTCCDARMIRERIQVIRRPASADDRPADDLIFGTVVPGHQQTAAQRHDHRIMQEGKLLIRTVNDLRAKSFDVLLRRRG